MAVDAERAAQDQGVKHDEHHDAKKHDDHHDAHHAAPHESPWVVTLPLVLLAIPSVCAGWIIGEFVFGRYFGNSIVVFDSHPAIAALAKDFQGVIPMILHGFTSLPFWFAVAGAGTAYYIYVMRPDLPAVLRAKWGVVVKILMDKYGFDRFNDWFFAGGARKLGGGLWKGGDVAVIDNFFVNGSARVVGWFSTVLRRVQSGYIYHYAFAMIIGILLLLTMIFRY